MSPENLQSYLNWFVYLFRASQAKDKLPETKRVVRHLLQVEAHIALSMKGLELQRLRHRRRAFQVSCRESFLTS